MQELPALFISHGAPDLVLTQDPARQALIDLGLEFPRPKGILIVSAHWQAPRFTLGEARQFSTIHDFSGFPEPLYRLQYPARGAEWLVELGRGALHQAGIEYASDTRRGLDHGAWIPLLLAWPAADIPILSLSLKFGATPQQDLEVGRALKPLRRAGVLVIASGSITHNLGTLLAPGSPPEPWALEFTTWVEERLVCGATSELLDYRQLAPHADKAQPTPEHFEPLLVAYGAGGEGGATLRHRSFTYGNLAMDGYAFDAQPL